MRFNRVLLLAASVNLAVLAMLFTISCSGDKGAKGKDADFSSCAVTDGELICGGVVIGPVGGTGPDITEPGDFCFAVSGTKVQCGDKTLDFGVAGCNVKEYKGRQETVQVNCSGDVFGICFGVPYDFSTDFCDYGVVRALPPCGASKTLFNPNNGEACVGGKEVVQCDTEEFYWTLSTRDNQPKGSQAGGEYNQCGVDTKYRECKDGEGVVKGIFFIGETESVEDVLASTTNKDGFHPLTGLGKTTQYTGTKYCAFPNTSNAEIRDCGAGYVTDPGSSSDPSKDSRAFSSCKLKANYAECYSSGGLVDAFDARTHICEGRSTQAAKIISCAAENGGFTEFVPKPGVSTSIADRQAKGYNECGLDPNYGVCFTNNSVTVGIYRKKDQICYKAGAEEAGVRDCTNGAIPNVTNRECLPGKEECEKVRKGFWDVVKQSCYRSAAASCFEDNTNPSTCRYFYIDATDFGWSDNGESTGAKCTDEKTGLGSWQPTVIVNGGISGVPSTDKFFDPLAGVDAEGVCYDNLKAWCDAGNGLWTGNVTSDPNEGKGTDKKGNCKSVSQLTEYECVTNQSKGYYWGNLQTVGNVGEAGFCAIGENEAAQLCESVGGYEAVSSMTDRTAGTYGWNKTLKECIRLYSANALVKSFKTQTDCGRGGGGYTNNYIWDAGVEKCFISLVEAEAECCDNTSVCRATKVSSYVKNDNVNWLTSGKCNMDRNDVCETGKWVNNLTCRNKDQLSCLAGGWFWDEYAPVPAYTTGPVANHGTCWETSMECTKENGDKGHVCEAEGDKAKGFCEAGYYKVKDDGYGLVQNQCVTAGTCTLNGGAIEKDTDECVRTCKANFKIDGTSSINVCLPIGIPSGKSTPGLIYSGYTPNISGKEVVISLKGAISEEALPTGTNSPAEGFRDLLTAGGKLIDLTYVTVDLDSAVKALGITLTASTDYYIRMVNSAISVYENAYGENRIVCPTVGGPCTKRYSKFSTNISGKFADAPHVLLGKKAEVVTLQFLQFEVGEKDFTSSDNTALDKIAAKDVTEVFSTSNASHATKEAAEAAGLLFDAKGTVVFTITIDKSKLD